MKDIILLVIFVLCISACNNLRSGKNSQLVVEWNNKEIRFPQHSVFTLQGKDTVIPDFFSAQYKIISYIDSVSCISCKLKLKEWNEFIKEVERLKRDKDVVFYFCFAMQNQHLLELILRRYHFDYPVYVDRAKEFKELNNFPDNMNFRTFWWTRTIES